MWVAGGQSDRVGSRPVYSGGEISYWGSALRSQTQNSMDANNEPTSLDKATAYRRSPSNLTVFVVRNKKDMCEAAAVVVS